MMRFTLALLTLLFSHPSFAGPETKLLLVGGGNRPAEAVQAFSQWAGGASAQVLIIGWASEIPEQYFETLTKDFEAQGVHTFLKSLTGPTNAEERTAFLSDLEKASAVFFTGGNQNRAMAVIDGMDLRTPLTQKFLSGTPFAGTSAGTALMANQMMTGDSTAPVGLGLGLFKKGMIDMHFLVRNREPRLLAAMSAARSHFGMGIDEDAALAIYNSSTAEVLSDRHVVFYDQETDHDLVRVELKHQERFNLSTWTQLFF